MSTYATIALPVPGGGQFTYAVPHGQSVVLGQQVLVSFGKRATLQRGFVTALADSTDLPAEKVKPIAEVITHEPPFTDGLLALCRWSADYYCCSLGEVLAAAYPFHESMAPKTVDLYRAALQPPEDARVTRERQRVLDVLREDESEGWPRNALAQAAGVTPGVVVGMARAGLLYMEQATLSRTAGGSGIHAYDKPEMTPQQERAVDAIKQAMQDGPGAPLLLHGVTGSGKTEVYIAAIEDALARGRSALVLVPEIGLTPQALDRYRDRFGALVALLHSGMADGERFDEWWRVRHGEARVVIGTRSAVFAPACDLGLIVVDEEHDGSYKQDDPAPRYQARDVAVMRARLAGAAVVLGSATPSMESYTNAKREKYVLLEMPERVALHGLPPVVVADHRGRPEEERIVTNELAEALESRLARGEQALLLLNRRGYAAQVMCGACGDIVMCDQCSAPMAYHRTRELLVCHHCENTRPVPRACPSCEEPLVRMRGMGTQQVVEWVQARFPQARVERMDTDAMRRRHAHDRLLSDFRNGDIDILVGTQMVAKGLDVPNVTLVGVINADAGLILPDFRAAERSFALLAQVAGRAGRGSAAGEVIVQTYCPNHYSVDAAIRHDFHGFYERERRFRRAVLFPPYARQVLLRVESRVEANAQPMMALLHKAVRQVASQAPTLRMLGPTEAPLYQLQGWFRWQLVLSAPKVADLRCVLDNELVRRTITQLRGKVKVIVDVDPGSLL